MASEMVASRTREAFPRRATRVSSAQKRDSALPRVVRMSCVEGDNEDILAAGNSKGMTIAVKDY